MKKQKTKPTKKDRIKDLITKKRQFYNNEPAGGAAGLYDLIKDYVKPDFIVVEIGSAEGTSTELFALHAKEVYAIDPWEKAVRPNAQFELDHAKESRQMFEKMAKGYKNIKTIKKHSLDAVADFEPESIDLIYIDGCHEEILKDIKGWFSRVKIGGVITGHDYIVNIKHRINRSLKVPDSVYKDSSWAIVKTKDLVPKK